MINNYPEFVLESLILESKLEFSDKFKRVLAFIPNDGVYCCCFTELTSGPIGVWSGPRGAN